MDSETFIQQASVSSVLSVGDYFPLSVAKQLRPVGAIALQPNGHTKEFYLFVTLLSLNILL